MFKDKKQIARRIVLVSVSLLFVVTLLASALPSQQASASAPAATCAKYHTVASGETLSSIALKYNVTVEEIAAANNLKTPYTIYVGQSLCIPAATGTTPAPTTSAGTTSGAKIEARSDRYGFITVATDGMKPKTPYYVKVSFYFYSKLVTAKLGTMRTDKNGDANKTFRLPKNFRNQPKLTVCLKNPYTDVATCIPYRQTVAK
jgi:hypothetical protein